MSNTVKVLSDSTGMNGRLVNPWVKYPETNTDIIRENVAEYEQFESTVKTYPFTKQVEPGAVVECRLVWQANKPKRNINWTTIDEEDKDFYSEYGASFREAYSPIEQPKEEKKDKVIHYLKTWQPYFDNVKEGKKKFEVRKNDRDYQVGDLVVLKEYDPIHNVFTDRSMQKEIIYILHGGSFGIEAGYCVLQLM